jgi:lysophospholipase L1-like esterase
MTVFSLFLTGILTAETVPIKLACIGNSITTGAGAKISYPVHLGKLLGPKYEVRNFGVSGSTMLKKGDGPYWNTNQYKEIFPFKPDIITIVLASNDAEDDNWKHHGEFKKDYLDFLDALRQISTNPKIFLGLPPPMIKRKQRNENLNAYIVIIKEIATEQNLPVIDLYTPLVEHPEYFPDGVHVADPGQEAIAKLMYEGLMKNTNQTKLLYGKPVRGKRSIPCMPELSASLISGTARDLLGRRIMHVEVDGVKKAGAVPKLLIVRGKAFIKVYH